MKPQKDPFIDPKKMDDLASRSRHMATTQSNCDAGKMMPLDNKTELSPTLRKNLNPQGKHKSGGRDMLSRGFKKYDSDMYEIGMGSLERGSCRPDGFGQGNNNNKIDRSISSEIKTSACRTTTNFGNLRDKNQNMSMGGNDAQKLFKQRTEHQVGRGTHG